MGEASVTDEAATVISSSNVAHQADKAVLKHRSSRDEVLSQSAVKDPKVTTSTQSEEADPEQLRLLVEDYSDSIFRLAYSIVSDRALAEDITQETLVKAWLALPSFRGEASLKGWILRIAHNTSISLIRSRKAVLVDPTDLVDLRPTKADTVEKHVEESHAYQQFIEALDVLDELSKSILVLREVEGLPYDEISRLLGVPLPTVKTRLLRSRRRLSTALKGWKP